MTKWLTRHWVAAALVMAVFLCLLAPMFFDSLGLALLLVYLQSPMYMFHQVEEHTGDRFRSWVNQKVFGGVEALSPAAIVWINIPGVWGVNLVSLYLARCLGIGWGLIGVYLSVMNAIGHIAGGIARRESNPGLGTSLALFVPIGVYSLIVIGGSEGVGRVHHAVGIAVALQRFARTPWSPRAIDNIESRLSLCRTSFRHDKRVAIPDCSEVR